MGKAQDMQQAGLFEQVKGWFGPARSSNGTSASSGEASRYELLLDTVRNTAIEAQKAQLQHAALLRDQMETLVNSVAEVDPLAREANKNGVARWHEIRRLSKELRTLSDKFNRTLQENERKATTIRDQEAALSSLGSENGELKRRIADQEAHLHKANEAINDKVARLTRLERRLMDLTNRHKSLEAKATDLETRAHESNAVRIQRESDISQLYADIADLKARYDELNDTHAAEVAEHEKTRNALDAALREKDSASQHLTVLRSESERDRSEQEAKLGDLKAENYQLDLRLSALDSRNQHLTGVVARQKDELRKCHDHIRNLERANRDLLSNWEQRTEAASQDDRQAVSGDATDEEGDDASVAPTHGDEAGTGPGDDGDSAARPQGKVLSLKTGQQDWPETAERASSSGG